MRATVEFTPIDALFEVIVFCGAWSGRHDKPGEMVQKAGTERRALLAKLTSDMAARMRFEPWMVEPSGLIRHVKDIRQIDARLMAGARRRQ